MPRRTDKTARTATAPSFPTDDTALTIEALRIASAEISKSAEDLEVLWPTSPLVERMRIFSERMTDLRTRIEAQ